MGQKFRSSALFRKALQRKKRSALQPQHIHRIIILGDSVAYGYGTKGGIAKHLQESFPASEVLNFGINGLTSDGLVERLRSNYWQQELKKADLVLLNIGGNDLLKQYQNGGAKNLIRQFSALKKRYRQNLLEIYKQVKHENVHVLIIQNSLYNSMKKEAQYFGFTNLLFRLWNSAIGAKGVVVTNTRKMGKQPSIWLDSIHPNEAGYALMHELLLETLHTTGVSITERR
ncbi:GDSL-type esterase/lipase family protein [Planococcus sp. ISL-109]|uniref:SGNH/GDSL hydrolase family protein n=1 Tax=Planococcus sp. ISL-109 TaxID=2819166 RepID=UPI001BECDF49|nr:GDSL-type esterase/lipase family protein [Planococcus sp. ISL-109]MBT2582166.1 hypothetical protein [Planococcus sp. ISL-109]